MKAKELRQRAWNALKGRYWWAVLAALIAGLFGVGSLGASYVASGEGNEVANGTSDAAARIESTLQTSSPNTIIVLISILAAVLVIGIAMSILSVAVKLGYCRFNMDLFTDVNKPTMHLLFSRISIVWKALWMEILIGLMVGLGCILLFFPGIIIGLAYSQAEFILAENPDLTAVEAMKRSRAMMKGNKWSLFCLSLSFFGWILLSCIVPAGAVFLAPYMKAADAAFYLDRTGRLSDSAKDLGELESKS